MALGKQVGRLSIRVLPDATKFRDDLKLLIKRVELSMVVNLTVEANTKDAELAIAKFRKSESVKNIDIRVGVTTAVAKAQLAVLSRARSVTLFVKVQEAALAKANSALASLSGARLASTILGDINEALGKIDLNVPKIARVATSIASLLSVVLVSSAGLVTLAGDLAKIGNTAFILPAMFTGMAVGIVTLAAALKDSKVQLAELAPAMHELQDSISAEFWTRAKQPILDLVQSVLPQLRSGFAQTAAALGNQASALSQAFQGTLANGVLQAMFDRLSQTMDIVTGGSTAFAQALTTIGTIGSNYLPRLATWVVSIGESFNAWLQDSAVSGRLDKFIEDGIQQMKYFGSAVEGFVGVLRGIDSAATAAGGNGLKSFAENLQGAAAAVQSPAFQTALTTILQGAGSALAGLGAGLSRFGEAIGVMAPTISAVLTLAGEALGGLFASISAALEQPEFQVGLFNFFDGIKTGIDALGPAMGPLFAFLGQLGTTVGVMAANFGPLLAIIKETFAPVLESILAAVTPLIPALAGGLTNAISGMLPYLTEVGQLIRDNAGWLQGFLVAALAIGAAVKAIQFGAMIVGLAQAAAAWVVNTAAMIANKIETIALIGMYAKDMVIAVAKTVAGVAISTGAWIANTVVLVASKIAYLAGAVAQGVATVAQYALNLAMTLNPIGIIIVAIAALVAGLIWFFTQTQLGQDIWANFTKFLTEAWANIVAVGTVVFTALGQFFTDTWNNIVAFITTAIDALLFVFFHFNPIGIIIANWDAIVQFFVDTWNNIVAFITTAISNVQAVIAFVGGVIVALWNGYWSTIADIVSGAWGAISGFVGMIVDGITNMITTIGTTLASIPGIVGQAFANAGTWLLNAGASIIQGLIDGIMGMVGMAQDAAKNVMDAIANFFPHSPAKEGPFSGRGWTLYSGQAMGDGLIEGMQDRVAAVRRSALTMIGAASVAGSSVDLADATAAGQARTAGDATQVTVLGDVGYDPQQIADEIDKKKRQAAMLAGLKTVSVA